MQPNILVVEDEAPIREMIAYSLSREGFVVHEAQDAESAYHLIVELRPDVALVDWMMPGGSGVELVRRLKRGSEFSELPVIMLTARSEESDKIQGLDAGADDYVTKPFSPRELIARIRALMRRSHRQDADGRLTFLSLVLDPVEHRCTVDESTLELGPTEFKLLHFLLRNPERVYSRAQLLDQVWGHNVYVEERTVDVHVLRLRKALAPAGYDKYVQTVRGVGYRLSASV